MDLEHYVNNGHCSFIDRSTFVKKTKSGRHVQRPLQAFQIFCNLHRQQLKQRLPHLNNAQLSKQLGELWSKMTPEHKSLYYEEARKGDKMDTQSYPYDLYRSTGIKIKSSSSKQKLRANEDSPKEVKFGGYVPPFHIFSSRMKKMKKSQQKTSHPLPPVETLIYNTNKPSSVDVCHQYHSQQRQVSSSTHLQDYHGWPGCGSRDSCIRSECEVAMTDMINNAGDYAPHSSPIGQYTYPRSNNFSNIHYSQNIQHEPDHYNDMGPLQTQVIQDSFYPCQYPNQRDSFFPNHSQVCFSPTKYPVSCDLSPHFPSCGPFSDNQYQESGSPSSGISDGYQYRCLSPDNIFHTQGHDIADVPQKSPYTQSNIRGHQYYNKQHLGSPDKQYQARGHQYQTPGRQSLHEKCIDSETDYVLIPCETKEAARLGWPLHILPKVSSSMLDRLQYDLATSFNYNWPTSDEINAQTVHCLTPHHMMQNLVLVHPHLSQSAKSNSHVKSDTNNKDHLTSNQSTMTDGPNQFGEKFRDQRSMTSDPKMSPQFAAAHTISMALDFLSQRVQSASDKSTEQHQNCNQTERSTQQPESTGPFQQPESTRPIQKLELTRPINGHTTESRCITATSDGSQSSNVLVVDLVKETELKQEPIE